ncbi:tetratricopeptide repeat-containing sulfotransferase family protein [Gilvimarinus sp. 1_MG-2023]|uniref:tetratricopeptide repeat-containing sulfotransferase family protein n=1 Tax=Gilvimarinus sp. 1_MG-2023 TaxID=3062638 RepID=UPI0026E1DD56|nr:tetratricopeptide repeat-containing sulfotransferase family protein [Gilvimarinus sp. 1_MG-2023]MDO6747515.1 sulfotransferase [Gilvimarinus sp. 1_MG-2023]
MTHSPPPKSLETLARKALGEGRDQQAYRLLGEILQQQPDHAEAHYLLSYIAHKYGNYQKEVELLQKASIINSENLLYKGYLARALVLCGEMNSAYQLLQTIDTVATNNPELIDVVATTYNRLNLYTQASKCYQRLVEIDVSSALVWFNLSTCYKYLGDFSQAKKALEKAVELKPNYEKAQAALTLLSSMNCRAKNSEDKRVKYLTRMLEASHNPEAQLHIAHALSKELEAGGHYSQSFSVLQKYKAKQKAAIGYSFDRDKLILDKLIAKAPYPCKPADGVENIFVTGMPRSGTTLVDRILCGSDEVISAGELQCFRTSIKKVLADTSSNFITPSCLAALGDDKCIEVGRLYQHNTRYLQGSKKILLDKLPVNILLADQLIHCLKNSVVVCLDRNPLDTIVSNYRQLFSFADGCYSYSLSLEDTALFYVSFYQLTRRLKRDYPERFFLLNYESLVQNQQEEAKQLFEFCQLPWSREYLNIENNTAPVATASALQVRQKIHTRSIEQWRHYDDQLLEVKAILDAHDIAY